MSRFGFKSGICLLIAPVPVHCFSIVFIVALDVNTCSTGMLLPLILAFPCHKMCNLADL